MVRQANLQRLASPDPRNKGGQFVSLRTQRRALKADQKRASKKLTK